ATTPQGVSKTDTVTGTWLNAGSGGALVDNDDGTGNYQCAEITDTVTLDLLFTGGPMIGQIVQLPAKGVVPPNGNTCALKENTGIWHIEGQQGVGMQLNFWATGPKNV